MSKYVTVVKIDTDAESKEDAIEAVRGALETADDDAVAFYVELESTRLEGSEPADVVELGQLAQRVSDLCKGLLRSRQNCGADGVHALILAAENAAGLAAGKLEAADRAIRAKAPR